MGHTCFQCNKNIKDESKYVECDGCKQRFHYDCTELTASELKVLDLKTKRTLKFFCDLCQEGLRLIPVLKKRLDEIDQKLADLEKHKFQPQESTIQASQSQIDSPISNCEDFIREMDDRRLRSINLMVYNIPESQKNSIPDKIKEDSNIMKNIFNGLLGESQIKKVLRIGKNGVKPRPIKLITDSRDTVLHLLRNRNKLSYDGIRISADLTINQRTHLKQLQSEVRDRNQNGENLTIKYIHGNPKILPVKEKN